ncbi:GH24292 [Drosophila grimshawi]|uniref:GH24292 n=1 Tax=Drosophila grimshawi TaxID=7222 RepID=B4JMP0_DROGR|nr:GH24292 [Drosophila grimshawi]
MEAIKKGTAQAEAAGNETAVNNSVLPGRDGDDNIESNKENMQISRKRKVDNSLMKNDKKKRKPLSNIMNFMEEDQHEQQQVQAPRDAKDNDNVAVAVVGAAPAAPSMLDKVENALTRPETLKSPVAAEQPMAVPISMPDAVPQPLFKVPAPPPPKAARKSRRRQD